jgi:hypothetical protein
LTENQINNAFRAELKKMRASGNTWRVPNDEAYLGIASRPAIVSPDPLTEMAANIDRSVRIMQTNS